MKSFRLVRVVTKDIVTDSFQGIRNLFGLRLRGYERVLDKHTKEMLNIMEETYNPTWFRMIINPLTNGSAMIIIYGEYNE